MGSKKLTQALFCIYFVALVWIILFKMQAPFSQAGHSRSVNLIPFAASAIVNDKIEWKEIIYNVLAFVPFGVFTSMLGRTKSWAKRLAPPFLTSLALETLQYVLAVGASDVTDLLGNTAGGMLGIGIFYVFSRMCGEKVCQFLNVVALVGAVGMVLLIGALVLAN